MDCNAWNIYPDAARTLNHKTKFRRKGIMKRLLVVIIMLIAVGLVGSVYAATVAPEGKSRVTEQEYLARAFASAKDQVAEGTVLSHDVACHCIVLQTSSGNVVVQDDYASFNQDYNRAKGLKIGGRAKITYKTVDYINYATKVEQ